MKNMGVDHYFPDGYYINQAYDYLHKENFWHSCYRTVEVAVSIAYQYAQTARKVGDTVEIRDNEVFILDKEGFIRELYSVIKCQVM